MEISSKLIKNELNDDYKIITELPTGEIVVVEKKNGSLSVTNEINSLNPSIGSSDISPIGGKYPEIKPFIDPLRQEPFNGMIFDDKKHNDLLNKPRYDDPTVKDESIGMGLPKGSFTGTNLFQNPFGRF